MGLSPLFSSCSCIGNLEPGGNSQVLWILPMNSQLLAHILHCCCHYYPLPVQYPDFPCCNSFVVVNLLVGCNLTICIRYVVCLCRSCCNILSCRCAEVQEVCYPFMLTPLVCLRSVYDVDLHILLLPSWDHYRIFYIIFVSPGWFTYLLWSIVPRSNPSPVLSRHRVPRSQCKKAWKYVSDSEEKIIFFLKMFYGEYICLCSYIVVYANVEIIQRSIPKKFTRSIQHRQ